MRKRIRWILIVLLAAGLMLIHSGGFHADHALASAPALELKKVISFPISGDSMPTTSDALAAAITDGLRGRVKLPDNPNAADGSVRTTVQATGGAYPKLDQLKIDLTDASITSDHQLPKLKPRGLIEQQVHAGEFQFLAEPMKVDGADIHLSITASDVALGLQRDPLGKPILILSEAKDGKVRCDTTMQDLSRIFRASADFRGRQYGLRVQQAKLQLTSDNAHQLHADLRLHSTLLLVPIALHMTAQADVDDAGNAKVTHLTCDGDDVAGWLICGFIRPALAKHNQKTVPLIAFPTDKIKLHDVGVKLDGDDVHVNAQFGS